MVSYSGCLWCVKCTEVCRACLSLKIEENAAFCTLLHRCVNRSRRKTRLDYLGNQLAAQ